MRKRRNMINSDFICPECGTVIPLPRIHGRRREKNHIKDLYCPRCKEVRKFKEISKKDYYVNGNGEVVYV